MHDAIQVAGLHGVWELSIGGLSLWRLTYTTLHDGQGAAAIRYRAYSQHTIDQPRASATPFCRSG